MLYGKILKEAFLCCSLLISMIALPNVSIAKTQWTTIAPGLEYTKIITQDSRLRGKIHAFRVDLDKYKLDLALAQDLDKPAASVAQLAKKNNALIAINSGFFTLDRNLIGLRIKDGDIISRIHQTSWWGVFYIENNKATITTPKRFRNNKKAEFAIQAGPRLIINNRIPSLKPGDAERTALGITKNNQLIIVVTEKSPMSTTRLAEIMRRSEGENGLACNYALNLDGGHSTQLYANVNNFSLHVPGFSSIPDALIVVAK